MTDPRPLIDAYAHEVNPLMRGHQLEAREFHAPKVFAALRAALDIHKPHESGDGTCVGCSTRVDTYDDISWPCPTVQAITKALEGS